MTTVNKPQNELALADSLQNENVLAFSTDSDILAQNSSRSMKVRKAPSLFNVITGPRGSLKDTITHHARLPQPPKMLLFPLLRHY